MRESLARSTTAPGADLLTQKLRAMHFVRNVFERPGVQTLGFPTIRMVARCLLHFVIESWQV